MHRLWREDEDSLVDAGAALGVSDADLAKRRLEAQ
jgi:hypothetical protein